MRQASLGIKIEGFHGSSVGLPSSNAVALYSYGSPMGIPWLLGRNVSRTQRMSPTLYLGLISLPCQSSNSTLAVRGPLLSGCGLTTRLVCHFCPLKITCTIRVENRINFIFVLFMLFCVIMLAIVPDFFKYFDKRCTVFFRQASGAF